ncbi:MAG: type II toxin-antitoxin system HicB family antitoxin [Methanothrix sp.]
MKRLHDHTVVIRPEDNGTFVAYVPSILGCHAWGRTPEEAQAELANVFAMINKEGKELSEKSNNSIHVFTDNRIFKTKKKFEEEIDFACPRCKQDCIFFYGEISRMELNISKNDALVMDILDLFQKLNLIWNWRAKQRKIIFRKNYFKY